MINKSISNLSGIFTVYAFLLGGILIGIYSQLNKCITIKL
jgi:hypothetical protein